jgi:hypothetical protein
MNEHSDLTSTTLGFIYPLFIVFGLYIIFNGHVSPGGGFQGGAVLSAMFINSKNRKNTATDHRGSTCFIFSYALERIARRFKYTLSYSDECSHRL